MILMYLIVFHEKQHQNILQNQYILYLHIFIIINIFNSLYQHFKHFINCNSVDFPLIKQY